MVRKIIFGIGLLLYLASLYFPAWGCASRPTFTGFDVLVTGWLGILGLDPRWFCNLAVWLAGYAIFEHPNPIVRRICFALAAVGSTAIFGPYFCGEGAGSFGSSGKSMALGGYLWIASLWIASFSTLDESDLAPDDQ